MLQTLPHQQENLPIRPPLAVRRAGWGFDHGFLVFAGLADEGAELLGIGLGFDAYPALEGVVVGDQVVAPLFCDVQGHFVGGGACGFVQDGCLWRASIFFGL